MWEFTFDEVTLRIEQIPEIGPSMMVADIVGQQIAPVKFTLVDVQELDDIRVKRSWPAKFQEAGLAEMSKAIEFDLPGNMTRTTELALSFTKNISSSLADEEQEAYWLVSEDRETGKITSIRPVSVEEAQSVSSQKVQFCFTPENNGGLLLRFFKSVIRKIKGTWGEMKKELYRITDMALFEPEGGFGFKHLVADCSTWRGVSAELKQKMENKRSLLFIHGIFSNVKEAFDGLAVLMEGSSTLVMPELYSRYEQRVFGYDHPTFSADALENALGLIDSLPDNIKLDIICHSRGGLVTRCLLEHPEVCIRTKNKEITFGNVLFVAGACKGSPLAGDDFLHKFLLLSTALGLISGGVGVLAELLKAAARFAHNAPGVICLDAGSGLILELEKLYEHDKLENKAEKVAFCRANYAHTAVPLEVLDEIVIDRTAFKDMANDMVVPYDTASLASRYRDNSLPVVAAEVDFDEYGNEQGEVWHLTYFSQPKVQAAILDLMTNGY